MKRRILARSAIVVILACSGVILPTAGSHDAAAQGNPTMSNVIPDGGSGAIKGKIVSMDAPGRQVTIVGTSGTPITMIAAPSVRLDDLEQGDTISAIFTRTVLWVVTPPGASAPQGATRTIGDVAHTPGGIGPGAIQIAGRVVKIDTAHSFDIADATGGGVYTIQVTDPTKLAMLPMLKVGDAVTASVTPMTVTAITKCGWFGCN